MGTVRCALFFYGGTMQFNISELAKSIASDMRNKSSNRLIKRGGTFEPGTYSVTIGAVDAKDVLNGRVKFIFESAHREQHNQTIWLGNYSGDGISNGLETLLWGLFGNEQQALLQFFEFLGDPANMESAFQLMRGMKLNVTIAESEGFKIVSKAGLYYAVDNKTNVELLGPVPRMTTAKSAALAAGYKEPKTYLQDAEPTHEHENIQALSNSLAALLSIKASGSTNQS